MDMTPCYWFRCCLEDCCRHCIYSGKWEYQFTHGPREYHQTCISNVVHGFLEDNPLMISAAIEWRHDKDRARHVTYHIELKDEKELGWRHIKHPILPSQCPGCLEKYGPRNFEKMLVVLHIIQRCAPYTKPCRVIEKLFNMKAVSNIAAVSKMINVLCRGDGIKDPFSIGWDARGKKRNHDGTESSDRDIHLNIPCPCLSLQEDEEGSF